MQTTIAYVTVKVNIVHRDDISKEDAVEDAMANMDYNMTYDHDGIHIAGTEIIERDYELEADPY